MTDESSRERARLLRTLDEAIAKLESAERRRHGPLSIVGLACRFPGAADPDAYWQLLCEGRDAVRPVPSDRWDAVALHDPDPDIRGHIVAREGGFLEQVDGFDASFFGIAPREALSLDPQQRLLLEVAWEALEDAHIPASRLAGARVGVFVGATTNDYSRRLIDGRGLGAIDSWYATGNTLNACAARIAYHLGLEGPAVTVDTACSSSLVAVHLAAESLRSGECDLAIAGGVSLMLAPDASVALSRARMLAPDGRCKTFDAAADGYGRGEGCGLVLLELPERAIAEGHRSLALLRATAVNHNGASGGFTVPTGRAQSALIRSALDRARLRAGDIGYIEAHGTGTALGDPIEVGALADVFAPHRSHQDPLLVGSVKTNFGHLEAAAGIAGLIKVVLSLRHGSIPRQLHLSTPNPHIPWAEIPIAVVREQRSWPEGRQIAGVSSFGASGTNAHAVVEAAPPQVAQGRPAAAQRCLLVLSAHDQRALRSLALRYAEQLAHPVELLDVAAAAALGREHRRERLVVGAVSAAEARSALGTYAAGKTTPAVVTGRPRDGRQPRLAFLFTGQGSAYSGMGRALARLEPRFLAALERAGETLDPILGRPLTDLLAGDDWLLDSTHAQPVLFALEWALYELWTSWGIAPDVVVGHSLGAYTAACAAGVMSFADGARVVAERGRLMAKTSAGSMVAVAASGSRVEGIVRAVEGVEVAALNGPTNTVIAGTEPAVREVAQRCRDAGLQVRELEVSRAFHTRSVDPILDDLEAVLESVELRPASRTLVSDLTGQVVAAEVAETRYWLRHARQPVRFAAAMDTCQQLGCDVFLEVGPHPILLGMARACAERPDELTWVASLRRGEDDVAQVQMSLAELFVRGVEVNWRSVFPPRPRYEHLPRYPWQRQRFWPETQEAQAPIELERAKGGESGGFDRAYEISWRLQPIGASGLAASSEVVAPLPAALDSRVGEPDVAQYLRGLDELEAVCPDIAAQALGAALVVGERFTEEQLAQRLEVPDAQRRLLRRLLELASEGGHVTARDGGWSVVSTPVGAIARLHQVLRRHPELGAEYELVERTARGLPQVLSGRIDGLSLLFPEGDLTSATALYRDSLGARVMNQLIADVVTKLRTPSSAPPRVLEVGSGTGATTRSVIAATDVACLVATDVSPRFVSRLREDLGHVAGFRAAVLDIERDPLEQGFEVSSFDLVVAANVLHATRDLGQSLDHVRRLLRPGGYLVLLETLEPVRFLDLVFGMTAGWWRFADARTGHPLVDAAGWRSRLVASGFDDVEVVRSSAAGVLGRQAAVVARAAVPDLAGAWWIVADRWGVAEILARRITRRGGHPVVISAGEPGALAEVLDRATDAPRGIVVATGLDLYDEGARGLEPDQLRGEASCRGVLHLVQAIAHRHWAHPPRVWLATRGAVAAQSADRVSGLAGAPLWGFVSTLGLEHGELVPSLVDVEASTPEEVAEALALEIGASGAETEVAWRDGQRHVRRLTAASPTSGQPALRAAATYLITGGLGALGLRLAGWLVARGARNLVLVGRGSPSAAASTALSELERQGACVAVRTGDVSDAETVAAVVASVPADRPLRGVFHLAGTLADGVIAAISWERFATVFAAKVGGAWNLHLSTRDHDLDHFVLFGTASTLLGSPGQANHTAANAFLAALADHRRARGLTALSLDWGAWGEIGAAATDEFTDRIARQGLGTIAPADALAALGRAMDADATRRTIVPVAWDRFLAHHDRPLYAELRPAAPAPGAAPPRPTSVVAHLRALPADERPRALKSHVCVILAAVLGLDPSAPVGDHQGFFDLGMDSLTAVELRNRMQVALRAPLPATVVFDHPTVAALVEHLWHAVPVLAGLRAEEEAGGTSAGAPGGETLDGLSSEQLGALLDRELESLKGMS